MESEHCCMGDAFHITRSFTLMAPLQKAGSGTESLPRWGSFVLHQEVTRVGVSGSLGISDRREWGPIFNIPKEKNIQP